MGCGGGQKAGEPAAPNGKSNTEGSEYTARGADSTETTETTADVTAVAPPAGASLEETTGDPGGAAFADETDDPGTQDTDNDNTTGGGYVADTTESPVAIAVKPIEPQLPFQERRFKEFAATTEVPSNVASSQPRRPSTSGTMYSDYIRKHAQKFDEVMSMEPLEGWTFKKEEDGVKCYVKAEPNMPVYSFKGVTEFPLGPGGMGAILMGLLNTEKRPEWDQMCISGRQIETYVPFYRVSYTQFRAQAAILSDRDLVVMGRMRFEEDGGVTVQMNTIDHPDVPQNPNFVRMNFVKGGYIIRPTSDPTKVRVTWTGCVEPKGWLPGWLVNAAAWKQALTLAKFRTQVLSKQQLSVPA